MSKEVDLPIFYQPWYLDVTCQGGEWDVLIATSNGEVKGLWPFFIKKKYGLSYITLPPLTPFLGPVLLNPTNAQDNQHKLRREQKKVLSQLANELPKTVLIVCQTLPEMWNWQPLSWLGFSQTTRYTFRINLSRPEADLFQNISPKTRQRIKVAKERDEVIDNVEISMIDRLLDSTFDRQSIRKPIQRSMLKNLDQALELHNKKVPMLAKYQDEIVAGTYLIHDHEVGYLILTGRTDNDPGGSVALLVWESIVRAKKLGLKWFDFEGSMIEGVANFFSSFGSELTPYHRLTKTQNQFTHFMLKALGKI